MVTLLEANLRIYVRYFLISHSNKLLLLSFLLQRVLDYGALPAFERLLAHEKQTIQKEAAWAISNITAGTSTQIQSVIDSGLIPPLIHLLSNGDFKTQKEACWAITNYTSGATTEQLIFLANNKAIEGLCGMLTAKEAKILQVISLLYLKVRSNRSSLK